MRKVRIAGATDATREDVDDYAGEGDDYYDDTAEANELDEPEDGYYDDDADEFDEEDYYEQPVGLLGSPGRVIMLVTSAILLFGIAAVSAWLLGQRGHPQGTGIAANPGIKTGVQVGLYPPDFELLDIYSGKAVKLSAYRGKQPVWVNFWASWCEPCKAEMPEMQHRYDKYKDKGLAILGIDDMEDHATVKQYVELGGYSWTFAIDGSGEILQKYFVTGIPTHVFVDKTGIIRSITVGGISGAMMDDGLNKILGD
jgi:thiol-disulfide isomerase/thioredoxin